MPRLFPTSHGSPCRDRGPPSRKTWRKDCERVEEARAAVSSVADPMFVVAGNVGGRTGADSTVLVVDRHSALPGEHVIDLRRLMAVAPWSVHESPALCP
jgi:hypothetical protein